MTFSSLGNTVVGKIVVLYTFRQGWYLVFAVGMALMGLMTVYRGLDRKRFRLLYETTEAEG